MLSVPNLWTRAQERFLNRGIRSNDSQQARRLTLINFACYAAALSSGLYAVIFAFYDLGLLWPMVVGNLLCVSAYLLTPVCKRWSANTAATAFTLIAYTSLFLFGLLLGQESGIQLNFMAAGALGFVLYNASHLQTITGLLFLGLGLHLIIVLYVPHPIIQIGHHQLFLDLLYVFSAGSSMIIVASVVWYAFQLAAEAEERIERLLLNILPESVATRLKINPSELIADRFESASVLFADLVDFTPKCIDMPPKEMVTLLNEIFSRFDALTVKHRSEKIKTIGDAYMAVSGIPVAYPGHAGSIISLAVEMLQVIQEVSQLRRLDLQLRIGIATGSITAGVIGKSKFAYDVWSPTVNLAARLESSGEQGRIHICNATKEKMGDRFFAELAIPRELKGIGLTTSWFVVKFQ